MTRCLICGERDHVCGPRATVEPSDTKITHGKAYTVSDLALYDVVLNGSTTTMQLTEADAKRYNNAVPHVKRTRPVAPDAPDLPPPVPNKARRAP